MSTNVEATDNFASEEEKRLCRELRVKQIRVEVQRQHELRLQRLMEAEKQAHERRERTLREIRDRLAAKHREIEERRKKALELRNQSKAEILQAWRKGFVSNGASAANRKHSSVGRNGGTHFVSMTTSWAPDSRPRSATGRLFGFGSSVPRPICEPQDTSGKLRHSSQLSAKSEITVHREGAGGGTGFGMNPRMCQSIHVSRPSRMMDVSFMGPKTANKFAMGSNPEINDPNALTSPVRSSKGTFRAANSSFTRRAAPSRNSGSPSASHTKAAPRPGDRVTFSMANPSIVPYSPPRLQRHSRANSKSSPHLVDADVAKKKRIEPLPEPSAPNKHPIFRQSMDNLMNTSIHRTSPHTSVSAKTGSSALTSSARVMSQPVLTKHAPEKTLKKKSGRQPPDLVISASGVTQADTTGNNSPLSPNFHTGAGHTNGGTMTPTSPTMSSEEELYKAKLAEQRRLAREKREREQRAVEEARMAEKARLQELSAQRKQEEEERRREAMAAARAAEEARLREEEDEKNRKEEQERLRDKELQEEKEKAEREKLARLQRVEEEREERKRKLELIMSRVKDGHSPASGDASPLRALSPLPASSEQLTAAASPSLSVPASSPNTLPLPGVSSPNEAPKFRSPLLQSMINSGKLSSLRAPAQTPSPLTSPSAEGMSQSSRPMTQSPEMSVSIPISPQITPATASANIEITTNEDEDERSADLQATAEEGDDSSAEDSMHIHQEQPMSDDELPAIEEESESDVAAEEAAAL